MKNIDLSAAQKRGPYGSPLAMRVRRAPNRRRRGMAIILVLAMISMTMAVSYSLLRSQSAQLKSAGGSDLRTEAREAALSGMSAALRRMNQTSWSGADSTVTGTLSSSQSYSATYTTGDATIGVDDANAADWSYRVTIDTTGYATDTSISTVPTTYKIQAVAKVVLKQVSANPTIWPTMQNYVIYQTATDDVDLQIPFRCEGPVRFQGSLTDFCKTYPSPTGCRSEYLSDLNEMRTNGYGDHRPFTGPIYLPTGSTSSTIRNLFTSNLGLTVTNMSATTSTGWSTPSNSMSTYQLYPGGRNYTIPTLATTVSGTTLGPDPRTNPAGLFYRNGDVTLGNNTSITGTIISSGKVKFTGTNVAVQAHTLPAIEGSSTANQLPAVISTSDITVGDGATATVRGTMATFAKFSASAGTQDSLFDLKGKLICRQMEVLSRSEWNLGSFWWSLAYSWFNGQENDNDGQKYLPIYMQNWGMYYPTKITITGPTGSAAAQQWFAAGTPLFIVGTGDSGLRWSIVRMKENP
jgi:hypothetical protein